jgi:hypothetical protein
LGPYALFVRLSFKGLLSSTLDPLSSLVAALWLRLGRTFALKIFPKSHFLLAATLPIPGFHDKMTGVLLNQPEIKTWKTPARPARPPPNPDLSDQIRPNQTKIRSLRLKIRIRKKSAARKPGQRLGVHFYPYPSRMAGNSFRDFGFRPSFGFRGLGFRFSAQIRPDQTESNRIKLERVLAFRPASIQYISPFTTPL